MQRIEIVCKMNVARSPFLATFLRFHFPGYFFSSSGTNASDNRANSKNVSRIATKWGFPIIPKMSKLIQKSPEKFYFPVDDETQKFLETQGYARQIIDQGIQIPELFFEKPKDLLNYDSHDSEIELAKLLSFSVKCLRKMLEIPKYFDIIQTTVNTRENELNQISRILTFYGDADYFIVNTFMKKRTVHENISIFGKTEPLLSQNLNCKIFSPEFEIVEPEKLMCSRDWRSWLDQLSLVKPVVLLTPELRPSNAREMPDAILASIWSTKFMKDFLLE